jgi:hypothetical protein
MAFRVSAQVYGFLAWPARRQNRRICLRKIMSFFAMPIAMPDMLPETFMMHVWDLVATGIRLGYAAATGGA